MEVGSALPTPDDVKQTAAKTASASSDLISKGCGWGLAIAALAIVATIVMTDQSGQKPGDPAMTPKHVEARPSPRALSVTEQQQLELANKAKIEELKVGVKTLAERDYEGRVIFWKDIVALAPANKAYAEELRKSEREAAKYDYARLNPEKGATIEKIAPRKEGFGNVLVIDITIRNDSLSHLKDFQIVCENKGNSGSTTDVKRSVLYERVEARTSKAFKGINMGLINNQTVSTSCDVEAATIS